MSRRLEINNTIILWNNITEDVTKLYRMKKTIKNLNIRPLLNQRKETHGLSSLEKIPTGELG